MPLNWTSNRLLNLVSAPDRALLAPHLQRQTMVQRQSLEKPNKAIEHVYFPEDGIALVVGDSKTTGAIEVGIIGKEGMTGLMVVLGNDRSPLETFCQVPGSVLVISTKELRQALDRSRTLRPLLLRYVQIFVIQTSQAALANAAALLIQRLARLLLMCQDRLNTKRIPLTHDVLSKLLGVQRTGVTIALGELESRGLIGLERGLILILDRPALMKLTNGSYGVTEKEYERRLT